MPRDDPHRRTRARVRVMAYLMLDITYNLSHRPSPTYCVNPALDSVCADSPCKRSIWLAPLPTSEVGMTRISVGKLRGLQQISDDTGRFTMIAMDQRGSLQKMLHPENPKAATYSEMEAVKLGVTEALAPHASGYLLDPEFGVAPTINQFALPGRTGLLVALEQSGYEKKGNWRLTTLLDAKVTNPDELRKNCERLSRATKVPWVVLSAGADFNVFRGLVELACRGGASGFLAGRAIWKDAFREKTLPAQMEYVRTQGVQNFQALADLAHQYARPWWDFYGGKERLRDHFEGWYVKY